MTEKGLAPNPIEVSIRRKRRRNSSVDKSYNSIYYSDSKKKISQELENSLDSDPIIFADKVLRMTSNFTLIQFQFIITKKNCYLFKDSNSSSLVDKFSIHIIDNAILSHQSDNFLLLRLKDRSDCLLVSRRKMEIINVLSKSWDRSSNFPLSITDRFRYTHDNLNKYAIIFIRTEFGVKTSIYLEVQNSNEKAK